MDYIQHHVYPLVQQIADPASPIFFILDGHVSHFSWEFLSFCFKHNMLVLCLPPHATHILQALDMGVFVPLQHASSEVVDSYTRDDCDVIRKGNFWPILQKARKRAFTKKNIPAGWEGIGLYPTNDRKPLRKILHLVKPSSPKHPPSSHTFSTPYTAKALK